MVLPFFSMVSVLLGLYLRFSRWVVVLVALAVLACLIALVTWALYGFWEDPEALNNYHPSRGYSLSFQCLIALGILGVSVIVHCSARKRCMNREVGEF